MERIGGILLAVAWALFLAAVLDYRQPSSAIRFGMFVASPVVAVIAMLVRKGRPL